MMHFNKMLLEAAHHYASLGLSPIPVDRNKQSCVKWGRFQQSIATAGELDQMFSLPAAAGLALVCGSVSGGLEVIDVDDKNDIEGQLFQRLWDHIDDYSPTLAQKLVTGITRSGGHHIYYRCGFADRNHRLAARPTTAAERLHNPQEQIRVLVETRGHKGYVIAPPTTGYQFLQHSLDIIPFVTTSEREAILRIARSFNRLPEKKLAAQISSIHLKNNDDPLTDYDQRADVIDLLQKHGWTVAWQDSERTYVKRPGDTANRSSGNYHHLLHRFKVFSTSTQFEAEEPYKPSAVFAILECNGDFKEAARRLLKMGYGKARLSKYQPDTRRQKGPRG